MLYQKISELLKWGYLFIPFWFVYLTCVCMEELISSFTIPEFFTVVFFLVCSTISIFAIIPMFVRKHY